MDELIPHCKFCNQEASHYIGISLKDYYRGASILVCDKCPDLYSIKAIKEIARKMLEDSYLAEQNAQRESDTSYQYSKKKIDRKLAWQVFKRDGFKCLVCKIDENLSVDHIIPESKGGELELNNLQTLCKNCNSKKMRKTIDYRKLSI